MTKNFQICTWGLIVVQYLVQVTISPKVTQLSFYVWENKYSKNCSFWIQDYFSFSILVLTKKRKNSIRENSYFKNWKSLDISQKKLCNNIQV